MKKGIFSSWLREFATIVFTQTVQAFLLAIVLSIIVSSLADSGKGSDGIGAAGLLAVIALSSFGKIELLIKQIFGVTSSFGDPGSMKAGSGLTTKGVMALRGVKSLGDNIGKFREGNRQIKMAQRGMLANGGGNASSGGSGNPTPETPNNPNTLNEPTTEKSDINEKLQLLGTSELTKAIGSLQKSIDAQNKDSAQSKNEKYKEMLTEGKNMKRSAVRESVLATGGAAVGAIAGLAQGEDVLQNAAIGAGAGDTLGRVSAENKAKKEKYQGDMKKLNESIRKLSDKELQSNVDELQEQLKKSGIADKNFNPRISVSKNNDGQKTIKIGHDDDMRGYSARRDDKDTMTEVKKKTTVNRPKNVDNSSEK